MEISGTDDDVHGVKLSWNKVTGATAYGIQKWNPGGNGDTRGWDTVDADKDDQTTVMTTSETSYTDDDDLDAGGTYWYIVRAVNGDVQSPWSAPVSGSAKADPPTALALSIDPTATNMVRITWAAADDATGYELEWIKGGLADFTQFTSQESKTLSATSTYYSHSGLTPGTRYSYRLRAVLPQGVMSVWQDDNIQVVTRPVAPDISATAVDHDTMKLTWDMVGLDGSGVPVGDYEIERRKTGDTAWIPVVRSTETDETALCDSAKQECTAYDNGVTSDNNAATLEENTKYFYRVRVSKNDLTDLPEGSVGDDSGPGLTSYWDYTSQRTSDAPDN